MDRMGHGSSGRRAWISLSFGRHNNLAKLVLASFSCNHFISLRETIVSAWGLIIEIYHFSMHSLISTSPSLFDQIIPHGGFFISLVTGSPLMLNQLAACE